jgi:hypothetical protein
LLDGAGAKKNRHTQHRDRKNAKTKRLTNVMKRSRGAAILFTRGRG